MNPGLAVPGEDDEGGGGTQGSDGRRGVQGVPQVAGGRPVVMGMLSTVVSAQYCPYFKPENGAKVVGNLALLFTGHILVEFRAALFYPCSHC